MQPRARIDALQTLRALAALLVAAFHLHAAAVNETGTSGPFILFQRGEAGVDLFFVLSGFIITHAALSRPDQTGRQFLAARFWRVVPPYWAAMSLYLAAALSLAVLSGDAGPLPDAASLIAAILLIPSGEPVVSVAWSLSIECAFYLLFAVTWFIFGKRIFLAALITWSVAAWLLHQTGHATVMAVLFHAAVPEFLLGTGLAFAVRKGWSRGQPAALVVGGLAFALAVTGAFDCIEAVLGRAFAFGMPAALLIWGALGVRRAAPIATVIGDASYLLYLLHLLVFYTIGRGVEMLTGFNVYTSTAAMLAMLTAATAAAVAAHLWLERPYQRWCKARRAAPGTAAISPAR
ncbi:MAG: acyltransferase [Pseudomonadota bacterium]